jgi:hypothetical protein
LRHQLAGDRLAQLGVGLFPGAAGAVAHLRGGVTRALAYCWFANGSTGRQ